MLVKDGQHPALALIGPALPDGRRTGVTFVKGDGVMLLLKRPHRP